MRVTIAGGGNIGTQAAVHFAESGHTVKVYTAHPEGFEKQLLITDETGQCLHAGEIRCATDDPKTAFSEAELILITYPAMAIPSLAEKIRSFLPKDALIGCVPGNGGGECVFRSLIERGQTYFALERVPAIARLRTRGKEVICRGYRNELHLAALPKQETARCCRLMEDSYHMPCKPSPGILNLTLTPSNPLLHTARLYTIFQRDCKKLPLFYEDWDTASSDLLLSMDRELEEIIAALPELDLSGIVPLRLYYEGETSGAMTAKISSIPAFRGIETPAVSTPSGFSPDLGSRCFTTDFAYGLSLFVQTARFADVKTPCMDKVLAWYRTLVPDRNEFSYADYGITTRAEFVDYYSQ